MRARDFIFERELNSDNMTQIKRDITDKVNVINDIDELHQIYSYIRKIDIGSTEGLEGIFVKDPDLTQVKGILSNAIVEAKGSFDEKMGFAKELLNPGIIDIEKLFTPGLSQNFQNIISTKYPNIFKSVGPTLLNVAGVFQTGNKKTNVGKGEIFLAVCHPNIRLSKSGGDLEVNGQKVEVKANKARLVGRRGYGTTTATYKAVSDNIANFAKKYLKDIELPNFNTTIAPKSNFWSEFGPFCIENGVDANTVVSFVKTQFKMIIKSLYLDLSNNLLNELADTIGNNGAWDLNSFYYKCKYVAFKYYQDEDQFTGIIFLNGDTLDFMYVDTPETFQKTMRTKEMGFYPGTQNGGMQIVI